MRFILLLAAASAAYAAAAPSVTGISAIFHDGQTFVTWTDPTSGSPANYRYNVYWSTSPIVDSTTLAAATLIQSEDFNNSGQLADQFPYSQTTRQNTAKLTAITVQGSCGGPTTYTACGTPVAPLTGIAVHTATGTASAYYAVITHDRTGALGDSPVSVGNNATTSPVAESVGTIAPIKYWDSRDTTHRSQASSTSITGVSNRPLWLSLHASGGCSDSSIMGNGTAWGDAWSMWGDSTMGYQEGVQYAFGVWETHSTATYGALALVLKSCDTAWTRDALGQLETFWTGYSVTPLGSSDVARMQTFTQAVLDKEVAFAIANYNADPNRIYQNGQSMGGWGGVLYALHRPNTFAAVFPSAARWRWRRALNTASNYPDMTAKGYPVSTATSPKLADDVTNWEDWSDSVAYANSRVAQGLPFIGWAIGRHDGYSNSTQSYTSAAKGNPTVITVSGGHGLTVGSHPLLSFDGAAGTGWTGLNATWSATVIDATTFSVPFDSTGAGTQTALGSYATFQDQIDAANALKAGHFGFAFNWSDGIHGDAPALLAPLLTSYETAIVKNISYPAFSNSSIDANPVTDIAGCMNCGWSWSGVSETATTWTASVQNSLNVAPMTADITPRNTQSFHLMPGAHVSWSTNLGQNGNLTADAYGLVTAPAVTVNSGAATTITFQTLAGAGGSLVSGKGLAVGTVVIH